MNKTKKLTQGAMLLAIFGALSLIDRSTGQLFKAFVMLIPAVVIVIYSVMHTLRDGVYLGIAILILSFVIYGFDIEYSLTGPVSVLTGIVYSCGIKKNYSRKKLCLISMIIFTIGEFLMICIITPLLVDNLDYFSSFNEELNIMENMFGNYNIEGFSQVMELFKNNSSIIIAISIVFLVISTGMCEGLLTHFLSLIILAKLKLKTISKNDVTIIKPNKFLSYISMFIIFAFTIITRFYINDLEKISNIYLICSFLSIFAFAILWFYGYLFFISYFRRVLKARMNPLLILLVILFASMLLVIVGFLYGAGPLQDYIDKKEKEINNQIHE